MSCNQCGGVLDLTDSTGATEKGTFMERYECVNCGAKGYITGKAELSPEQWNRNGTAFEAV